MKSNLVEVGELANILASLPPEVRDRKAAELLAAASSACVGAQSYESGRSGGTPHSADDIALAAIDAKGDPQRACEILEKLERLSTAKDGAAFLAHDARCDLRRFRVGIASHADITIALGARDLGGIIACVAPEYRVLAAQLLAELSMQNVCAVYEWHPEHAKADPVSVEQIIQVGDAMLPDFDFAVPMLLALWGWTRRKSRYAKVTQVAAWVEVVAELLERERAGMKGIPGFVLRLFGVARLGGGVIAGASHLLANILAGVPASFRDDTAACFEKLAHAIARALQSDHDVAQQWRSVNRHGLLSAAVHGTRLFDIHLALTIFELVERAAAACVERGFLDAATSDFIKEMRCVFRDARPIDRGTN